VKFVYALWQTNFFSSPKINFRATQSCGTAWAEQKSQLVPDVEAFPGHIACSSLSKSELVVTIFKDEQVWGVLDIDSMKIADFDHTDQIEIEKLMTWFATCL